MSFDRVIKLLPSFFVLLLLGQSTQVISQDEKDVKQFSDSLFNNPSFSLLIAKSSFIKPVNDSIKSEWLKKAGIAYYYLRDLDSAQYYYNKALKISNSELFRAKCYSNIGVCFNEKKLQDSAIFYYNKAIDELGFTKDPFLGMVHLNLTKLYSDLEVYKKAVDHGKIGVEILLQNEEPSMMSLGNGYLNLGGSFAGMNEQDSSIKYNQLAKQAYANVGHVNLEIAALRNLIKAYDLKEEQKVVLGLLKEFEDLIMKQPSDFNKMILYQSWGIYYYKTKDLESAKFNYELSLKYAEEIQETIFIKDLNQNLALVYESLGEYGKAFTALKYYHFINDSLEHVQTGLKILEIEEQFKSLQKDKEIEILNKDLEISDKNAELQDLKIEDQNQKIANKNLVVILIVFVAIIIIVSILFFLKRREAKIATKLLTAENNRLKTERKLIQSQMNPHFIFNTLNSIQRFVLEKDAKAATSYLGKFGKLLRKTLDFTRSEKVSLEEELAVLESYLEFEKLRFGNKFDFFIEDKTNAGGDIEVPPLIIQPFVENAILHGFKNINYVGKITVVAITSGDDLIITITDNGIGFKSTDSHSDFQHKSHGSDITRERLKSEHSENDFIIEDLIGMAGDLKGTRVTLKIRID